MSGIDVDLSVLESVAEDLDTGAAGLEDLAGSVPGTVDAGPMSAVVASMLGQVVDSAGNVSVALSGAADGVRLCRTYYQRADAESSASMDEIRRAMQ